MKKLFLKNGLYLDVKTEQDVDGQYISVYIEGRLHYSIFNGKTPFRNSVIFGSAVEEFKSYEVLQMAEIIENFNQYFNNLNQ